jgi:hypothetical protein
MMNCKTRAKKQTSAGKAEEKETKPRGPLTQRISHGGEKATS